jgi:PAS domain S-box-containing protein
VNSAVKKIFGYEPHELIGKSLSVLMTEADGKRHREGLRRYAATGKRRMDWRGVLVNALHRDRHIFPLELSFGEYAKNGKRYFTGIARDVTERVNRENELRASEERRKLAQEAGNVGIWDWNVLEGRTYWSETMWSFYGEEPGDTNPDEEFWSAHIHPEDRSRVKGKLREIVASDAPEYHDEFRIVRGDGSVRWVESLAKIVRSEDGAATRMYGVNLDITERKNAEEIRRISENQLRVITDTVPALISYIDQDQRYRFVNQRYVEWFGGTKEDFIGKTIKDVAGSAAYEVVKPRAEAALRGEEVTFESLLKYESGDRYVRVSYVPDIALDGSVNGFFALVSDLTDLKRSQELLRSSEERLGTMIESLVDYAVIGLDSDGIIENWNRGAKIIFGYSPEEVCGKSFDMLFTQEDVSSGIPEAEVRKAAREGKAPDERWHVRKDGGRFYASGVTISINVDGQLTGFAKILSDLTEKQRHAEELQQAHDELERRVEARTRELAEANKALIQEMQEREVAERQRVDLLRRLVSSQEMERRRIARDLHDQLGQRLTALRLKIASLKVACEDHEDIAERVERLQEISERLDAEVSFLAWELRPSALDDLGLVDSIGAFVQEWSRHYDIPADFHVSGPSRFRLDREVETHLYRITQEALNNIAKHAEATEVTVLLERRGSSLILIIEDNGIGFDADNTVTPAESGKGLGLLGMTERASIAGGEVEIESTQGSGTTIYVRVPFNDDHE